MPEAITVTSLETGQSFGQWSECELQFGLDTYSAASLSGPFDHERKEVRAAFQPMAFGKVEIKVGEELVLTGKVMDVAPSVDPGQSSICVTVYSLAHELTEICAPPDLLPLEFNGLDLKQIAQRLAGSSTGIAVELDGSPGARFSRARLEPDGAIHDFLVELGQQRGYVLTDTAAGDLLFRGSPATGSPVAKLEGQPVTRVTAQFQPASWFSSITGRACQRSGKAGSSYTERNPLFRSIYPRTTTISLDDTESADVPKATKAAVGRMLGQVVSYAVDDLPTWRDGQGNLWKPNTTLTLTAPEAMIYRETELVIRSVTLRQTPDGETASLGLVLLGAFGGSLPAALPWDL
jgi:prophage tail gpP-like protein